MKKAMMIVAMIGLIAMAGTASAIVQDESGYLASPPWNSYSAPADYIEPLGGDGAYMYAYRPEPSPYGGGIWTPGLTGTYKVETSWCESPVTGPPDVDYFFRSDGTLGSEVWINNVDQRYLADGSASGGASGHGSWSDYYELGTVALNPSSTFRIDWIEDDPAITSGLWRFSEVAAGGVIPEPAGLGLIGLALLAVRRKRS